MTKVKKICLNVFVLFLISLMILRGRDVISYSHEAFSICFEMIVPTLFPFFVCSGILVYSGFCEWLSKIFAPVMPVIFGINPSGSAAFILGILSGYPIGAVTTCQLYKSSYLSKKEAERLLAFCNNSGPLFILCSVGVGLFSDLKLGIILYFSHILGAIAVGVILRIFSKPLYNPTLGKVNACEKNLGEIFSISLQNSVSSILTICASVVFFTVTVSLLMDFLPDFSLKPLLHGFLEISNGNLIIAQSNLSLAKKLVFSSAITGFAGLCVHLQVLGIVSSTGLKLRTYILGKLLHGIFSGLLAYCNINLVGMITSKKAVLPSLSYGFFINSLFVLLTSVIVFLLGFILKSHKEPNHCLRR